MECSSAQAADASDDRSDSGPFAPADQMHVSRPLAPGADGQRSREMRFGSGSKSCHLFMPHVDPLEIVLDSY